MHLGRTTLSKFLIEQLGDSPAHGQMAALPIDVAATIKGIAAMTAKGALGGAVRTGARASRLEVNANEEILRSCEWGGLVAGMSSRRSETPHAIPAEYRRGPYLLLFDALTGSAGFDLNAAVGSMFSLMPHERAEAPAVADYLRPGRDQLAAGYAIYGPATMLVLTVGKGTHAFTLDREVGNFILTHPDLRIPEDTAKFAVNTGNERFWEPPVRRYVDECKAGASGIRARDFSIRWIASMVAEVHRILVRGGVFLCPRCHKDADRPANVPLLHEANPLAFLVEQAGGLATTGRQRILAVTPAALHEQTPLIFGSRNEVERIERYHRDFDAGTDQPYDSPLFKERSLYRENTL
jgi:fructose-1,6-bisphosphatase I / sedoheptulose-1,7-bisphosphatase